MALDIPNNHLEKITQLTLSPGTYEHPLIHHFSQGHYHYAVNESIGLKTR